MSYCLRTSEEDNFTAEFNFQNTEDPSFTFIQLKEKDITSQMLLSWSASIDLAEQYEIFLHSDLNTSFNGTVLFHNCTSPWFGPLCRFTFDYGMNTSFKDIVDLISESKYPILTDAQETCYKHLHCQTILSCLDWREICDRKSDCLDSSDERDCWQLEINSCNENEFRCHNGLCIPMEFFHDDETSSDCLDRTDELSNNDPFTMCIGDPSFECEEHMCGPNAFEFPCGDGQCSSGIDRCNNGRSHLLPSVLCAYAVSCYSEDSDYSDDDEWCDMFCSEESNCIAEYCAEFYDLRYAPVLFGHVRLIYLNNGLNLSSFTLPDYVCYDENLCADFLPATEHFNNWTCRRIHELGFERISSYYPIEVQIMHIKNYFRACLVVPNETFFCNYSTMYLCQNSSKCISKQRLLDSLQDCPYNDDETYNQSCSLSDIHQRYKCSVNGIEKCFASLFRPHEINNCEYSEDANNDKELSITEHIDFKLICDGKTDLLPVLIDEQNETDETNCEHWVCNNTYSRCDGFWLCKDGADEIDCELSSCPALHHNCVFPNDTSKMSCLPIGQAGNDLDDCLGGTDERKKYLIMAYDWNKQSEAYGFHCWNDTNSIRREYLCNKNTDCRFNDDELFCKRFASKSQEFCFKHSDFLTDVEEFLCRVTEVFFRSSRYYLKITDILTYPLQLDIGDTSFVPFIQKEFDSTDENETEYIQSEEAWWCNRGIPIRLRMDDNTSKLYCLCPPSYYGNRCQYQNQRVSLTLRIQVSSDWRKVFTFIITLIDDEKNIESYDYIEYLPVRDCIAKYNIYLLYATRPKNASKHYSVQIDAFNQLTLSYRVSWIFPLQFSFLPVHRLPVLLKVPVSNMEPIDQCWPPCIHGQCFPYANNRNSTFCRCQPGWSGAQCNIKYTCDCALGSICVSDSICLCPRDRFGSRCHLFQFPCRFVSCLNGGQCVPMDARYTSVHSNKSTCICLEGYTGDRCELRKKETQIDVSFHQKLPIPSALLIHLIDTETLYQPNSTSVMKKIAFDQYSITFYTSVWFHIAFVQMFNHYYLVILQKKVRITLAHISTQVIPSHRCQSIDELFNQTFAKQHLLKRIKYYHLPCQQQSELVCFYDEVHFCLCTLSRTANCMEFNHNKTYDCGGYNYCENGGHCIEENPNCPTAFCVCNQCYFGSRCQFSTKESILSLDIILGYHIRSGNEISEQPTIVKVAIGFTLIILFFGSMNTFLSLVTFREKVTCNVGCGLYLFASSIISMSIVIVSTVKFWLLLASQIGSINDRLFLQIQCMSLDFLLRSLLSMSDWFSACVAVERAVNVSQGINFNKSKSKQVARWIILIVILSISCTHIYDPLYRRLIDDEDEQRTWCVTQYPSSVQIFNWLLSIFHFSLPFSVNCISAVVVIITATRTRSNVQQKKPFKEHLREQLQHHKHLLISPLILVALALPRLIISFLSGCMKSARDSWLYMIGYFISFVPSMMTFVVFVLPSEVYRKEFSKSMKQLWQR